MNHTEIIEQTERAFDFVQKLYLEVSYLIKEVEGLLSEEDENFIIGRPSGYAITARSSTGLEPRNVLLWPLRKLAVFFVPEERTQVKGGTTITRFEPGLKVVYLRIVLADKDLTEPAVYAGVLYDFLKKSKKDKWPMKFEHLMATFEYKDSTAFKTPDSFVYEDVHIRCRGKLQTNKLFDIDNSKQIMRQIIEPTLQLYRSND